MSLDERAALFMRKFPSKKLTGARLWSIFRSHSIKFKVVRTRKDCPPHRLHVIPQQSRDVLRQLRNAIAAEKKIIYLDEVCFTKQTGKNQDWSCKGHNTVVD